jgi:hypothetical protein
MWTYLPAAIFNNVSFHRETPKIATSASCQLPFNDRIKGDVFMARVLALITLAIGVPIAMVVTLIP